MTSQPDYWNNFYAARHADIEVGSTFAVACLAKLRPGTRVFELGCGNGRDAMYFARHGMQMFACDRSSVAIETLASRQDLAELAPAPKFLVADFFTLDADVARASAQFGASITPLDVVYSRFTLHAVPAEVASAALAWAFTALRPGGQLLIEARSVGGSLYGKGDPAGRDAFIYNDHYRRFLRGDELQQELSALGFEVSEFFEGAGVAVYKDDDPVVLRVTARKP